MQGEKIRQIPLNLDYKQKMLLDIKCPENDNWSSLFKSLMGHLEKSINKKLLVISKINIISYLNKCNMSSSITWSLI
jgi:hypothetical protein